MNREQEIDKLSMYIRSVTILSTESSRVLAVDLLEGGYRFVPIQKEKKVVATRHSERRCHGCSFFFAIHKGDTYDNYCPSCRAIRK